MRGGAAALAFAAAAVLSAAGDALACSVCIARPEATLADRVLAAETVALMREYPDRPLR